MPDFGWELPPGVTHEMIEERFGNEKFLCATCARDVTNDSAELVCEECGDPLCSNCFDGCMRRCENCHMEACPAV